MLSSISSLHTGTPRLSVLDARGLTVRTVEFHRATSDVAPQGRPTRYRFDASGRHVASQDPRLGQALNSVENRVDDFSLCGAALGSYSVDSGWEATLLGEAGESSIHWDGKGQVRHTSFDELLRPAAVSERSSEGAWRVVERLTYGGAGEHERNGCGRLARHDDTAGSLLLSEYGLSGKPRVEQWRFLTDLDDPDWPLDTASREGLLEPAAAITCRRHNALGEPLQLTDARQNIQRFAHGVDGHVREAWLQVQEGEPRSVVSQILINALGQLERETAGNGVVTSATYCPGDGRLLRLESTLPGKPAIQDLSYHYDPLGNVTAIEDLAQSSVFFRNQQVDHVNTYVYDSLSQLIGATGFESVRAEGWQRLTEPYRVQADPGQLANYREQYSYDLAGNLQTLTHVGGHSFTRRTVTSLSSNRSLQVQDDWVPGEPDIAEGFDVNGNQLELLRGQRLEWGPRNQLRQVTPVTRESDANDFERYLYNRAGERVRKVQLSQGARHLRTREVRYVPELELHVDSVGEKAWHRVHIQVGRTTLCWNRWEQGAPNGGHESTARYSLADHLNSATLEIDDAGVLMSQESYYPYGATAWWSYADAAGCSFKSRRFTGKEQDATGLYYYGMRYYAPWLGRWINPDPGGDIDGLNRYRFVRNNPVTMTDPHGRAPTVTLLYGFDPARDLYLSAGGDAASQNITTIDLLNAGVGITPDTLKDYYNDTIEPFFESSGEEDDMDDDREVPDEGVELFLEKAEYYKGGEDDARKMLQSWSDFLYANSEKFNVQNKLRKHMANPAKIAEFWKKNLDASLSERALKQATQLLLSEPEKLFEEADAQMKEAAKGVANWVFRQLSKLGLEWAHSDSPSVPDEVHFADIGLKNPADPDSGWEDLGPQHFRAQRYKTVTSGSAYDPITYSERRHVERNNMQKVRFIRTNQLRN